MLVDADVHTPDGLAVDWIHNLLFWTDGALDQVGPFLEFNLQLKGERHGFDDEEATRNHQGRPGRAPCHCCRSWTWTSIHIRSLFLGFILTKWGYSARLSKWVSVCVFLFFCDLSTAERYVPGISFFFIRNRFYGVELTSGKLTGNLLRILFT